jgi:outer membrane protein assembly factor BamB/orotate phosphoribosyltransferase
MAEPSPAAQAASILQTLRQQPAWQSLRRDIIARALRFSDNPVFDFRLLLTDPCAARQAGAMLWQLIRPFRPQVLVGPGFGAAPLLFAIAGAALDENVHLKLLMVRDQRKSHNQKKWVEGRRQPDHSRAVMVDDFMEAGSALPLVEQALAADGHVLHLLAVALFFDMWQPLGSRQVSTGRLPVVSLYRRHDIGLSRDCFDARPPAMTGQYPAFIDQPLWWRYALNDRKSYPQKCASVIADGAVFVADDHSRVWRHDALCGDIQWRYDSLADPRKGIVQLLQHADGSLVFGCYDGTLVRLDAASGGIVWRWRLDSSIHATPELDLAHQRLYINTEQWNKGTPSGRLLALDWRTGKPVWGHAHRWWPPGSPAHAPQAHTVVATCNDHTVVAVNAGSGALRWRVSSPGLVRGKPAVHGDKVLLATEQGYLQCLDLHTGEERWRQRYGRGQMHQFPHVHGDTVITLDGRWHLVAFDLASGAIRWMSRLRSAGNWRPVACGAWLVVLSREGHLAVFDPEHEIKVWEGHTGMMSRQPPAIGQADGMPVLAVAGNAHGLQLYRIHPYYARPA